MKRNGTDSSQQKQKYSFRAYISFYTRFPIPWWLFIVSLAFGLVNTEVVLAISKYVIQINKGELYNGVIIGYSLLTVLNAVIAMFSNLCGEYGIQKVTLRARMLLWNKILHLPMREVERRQPSSLISGVVNDITQASAVIHMIFSTVASIYGFIRCCVEMARFNAKLSAYMLLLVPLAIGVFVLVGQLQYRMMLRRYESLSTMTEFFSEHISAAKHVKAQAIEELEAEEGFRAIDERYKADIYYAFMEVLQVFSNTLYTSIGSIAIALFGSDMIRKGQMPDTGINDFTTYKGRVDQYQAEVLTHYQTLKGTQGAMRYVGVLLDGPEEDPDAGYDLPKDRTKEDILLERVSFGYDPRQPVLHDLSLTIPAGRTTAIIGNNGCGKSTLLKLIQGIYLPDSGRVWLGDSAVDKVKLAQLRRRFGCIFQHNPLFSGSVRDNIAYGETGEVSDEAVAGAARLADADGFISQLPEGYDSDVGMGGALLSGGQRQRVAIARTLLFDPDYLLMDEAGASLDHKSDRTIFRAVREHMRGRTIVVVAHDMRTVMEADHIIVLNSGSLEATGTHEELLKTSPTYRNYLELQGYALAGEEAGR
ncbi:ABC transporter ATP-binding protein [Acutalibacter intestini]|uniref:ABC transporter ATP-binding protein n=1 Tax=Acutalibacter intestini TaxID=3093659 RepID=UPI002AC9EF46|nr:ABC transporter ATP-binding protein [Acutalibacter sp. M00204]